MLPDKKTRTHCRVLLWRIHSAFCGQLAAIVDDSGIYDGYALIGNHRKQRFDTQEEVARNIIAQVLERSVKIDKEVCGLICQDNFSGKYFLAKETWWLSTACIPGYRQYLRCGRPAAWWHTHGAAENSFFQSSKSRRIFADGYAPIRSIRSSSLFGNADGLSEVLSGRGN